MSYEKRAQHTQLEKKLQEILCFSKYYQKLDILFFLKLLILNVSLIAGSVLIISDYLSYFALAISVPIAGILQMVFISIWLVNMRFSYLDFKQNKNI